MGITAIPMYTRCAFSRIRYYEIRIRIMLNLKITIKAMKVRFDNFNNYAS